MGGSVNTFTPKTRSNLIDYRKDVADEGTQNAAIGKHKSRRILDEKEIPKETERKSSHILTRSHRHTPSSKNSENVEDKESALDDIMKKAKAKRFLTTVPNRRNQKKKRSPV